VLDHILAQVVLIAFVEKLFGVDFVLIIIGTISCKERFFFSITP